MTLEQFVNKVRNAVHAYFGDRLSITAQKIMKNNGIELTGLIFNYSVRADIDKFCLS